jgi:chloramphenicol 3-O-phosphotransferase
MILTGAPGSGKSSVLDALGTLLEIEGLEFGAIESEELARGSPWLTAAQWLPGLAAVVALQRAAGRETFLVAATTETEHELNDVVDAVGAERVVVICLSAPRDVVAERVARREPDSWPGKRSLVEHARHLADEIPAIRGIDAVIPTAGREPAQVAGEIKALLVAGGIVKARTGLRNDLGVSESRFS